MENLSEKSWMTKVCFVYFLNAKRLIEVGFRF